MLGDFLEPQLGPSEEVAQFEDLDDALMRPLEQPELPDRGELVPPRSQPAVTPGDDARDDRPATPADAPIWGDIVPPYTSGQGREPDDQQTPESQSLEPSPLRESLPPQTDPNLVDPRNDFPREADPTNPSSGNDREERLKPAVPIPGTGPSQGLQPFGEEQGDGPELDPESDFFGTEPRDEPPSPGLPADDSFGPRLPDSPAPSLSSQPALPDTTGPIVRRALRPSDAPAGTEALRVAIDGGFLGRLFEQSGCTSGAVSDAVMDARVSGRQTTRTQSHLELRTDAATARMVVVLDGTSTSNTVGRTPQADVISRGSHVFRMEKPIAFDGQTFRTRTPAATVWPQQRTEGAVARVGQRVPVVRRLASRIAYEEAMRRQPRVERIAADRLSDRVSEQFNARVDAGLARLQSVWTEKALDNLSRLMLDPAAPRTATTESHVLLSLPTSTARPSTPPPPGWEAAGPALAMTLHESAINAALGRLPLAGRELQSGEWRSLVQQVLPSATEPFQANRPGIENEMLAEARLRLLEVDPVQVRFEGGRVEVELRAVVVTPLGESTPQRIVMPWRVAATATETRLTCDNVEVRPLDPAAEAGSADLMDLVRSGIEQRFNAEIRPLTLPRTVQAPLGDDRQLGLTMTFFRSREGWLVLGWRTGEQLAPAGDEPTGGPSDEPLGPTLPDTAAVFPGGPR